MRANSGSMKRRSGSSERQFPQCRGRDRLYTFRKNEYSTAAVEYAGAVPPEPRVDFDMTAPGTAREEYQPMEFSVTKSALLTELSMTQGVVERKTTIPILSNLLVEASHSQLTITATDLELSIRTLCDAKVKQEGAGTIPAKKLLELVRLLPEGEIKVKLLENHWVEITSDRKKYKLVGMAKENFPALPAMPHTLVKIPAAILQSLISKTKFAISMEESRYTLNGGLLILRPDTLAMVATDGHRLALAETDHKLSGMNGELKVLVPKKAMDEVEKLSGAAESDAQFDFAKDESHLFFQVDHRLLISARMRSNSRFRAKASRFPHPARNTAKPRKALRRNTRATPSRSASIRATCWIF